MIDPIPARAAILSRSNLFDPVWYRRMHRDVGLLGMDAAQHYLRYGHGMGRMSRPGQQLDDETLAALDIPPPRLGQVIKTAHDLALEGQDALAIALAELHLPETVLHTAHALRANAALKMGDPDGWLRHLNIYLAHYRAPEVLLGEGPALLDRLGTAPLAPVTDGPLVTVIMPAWNAERTVRAAARSILDQSWRQLELIIVDDASEDATPQVLQQIAAADPRVRVLRNRVNVGPYVSKNIALMQAKGAWITGHDADDWSFPNRLHDHMTQARATGAPASYTYMLRMLDTGELNQFSTVGGFSRDGIARVASISTLFAADFLRDRLGAWDSVRFGADSELISRARHVIGDRFLELAQIGMLCLDVPQSLTNDPVTGIRTETGLSPVRAAYKAAWDRAHRISTEGHHLPFPLETPRYLDQDGFSVPVEDVRRNIGPLAC